VAQEQHVAIGVNVEGEEQRSAPRNSQAEDRASDLRWTDVDGLKSLP
jgi:hypothetical protein